MANVAIFFTANIILTIIILRIIILRIIILTIILFARITKTISKPAYKSINATLSVKISRAERKYRLPARGQISTAQRAAYRLCLWRKYRAHVVAHIHLPPARKAQVKAPPPFGKKVLFLFCHRSGIGLIFSFRLRIQFCKQLRRKATHRR